MISIDFERENEKRRKKKKYIYIFFFDKAGLLIMMNVLFMYMKLEEILNKPKKKCKHTTALLNMSTELI